MALYVFCLIYSTGRGLSLEGLFMGGIKGCKYLSQGFRMHVQPYYKSIHGL